MKPGRNKSKVNKANRNERLQSYTMPTHTWNQRLQKRKFHLNYKKNEF